MALNELQSIADSIDTERRQPLTVPTSSNTQSQLQSIYDAKQRAIVKSPTVVPETAKDIVELSNHFGHPPDTVERNLDTYRKRKQELDLTDFIAINPAMSAYFEQSPHGKSLAQDDYSGLNILNSGYRAVRNVAGSFTSGLVGTSTATNAILEEASAFIPTKAGRFLQDTFHQFRKDNEAIQTMVRGDQSGLSSLQKSALSGVESTGQQIIPTVMGVFFKAPQLALKMMGAVTAGLSFAKGLDQGLTPSVNFAYGAIQGTIEVLTEAIPIHTLIDSIGLRRGLVSTLGKQLIAEIPGEQVATLTQDFTDWAILPENKDKTLADYKAERKPAAFDTLVATVVSTVLLGGSGHAIGTAIGKAQQAKATKTFYEGLGKNAQDSKVRQRVSPEYQKILSHLSGENVHIPVKQWNTYWQEQGGDPREVASEVMGDTVAYDKAVKDGTDIAMPSSAYGNRIAPTDHAKFFNNILKASPDAMSAEEADKLMQGPELPQDSTVSSQTPDILTEADTQESQDVVDAIAQGATLDSVATEATTQATTPDNAKQAVESRIRSEKGKPAVTSQTGTKETIQGAPVTATEKQVKKQIRISSGMLKAVNLVREDKALNAAFKKAEQNSKIAFKAGNLEGVTKERKRMRAIFDTARAKVKGNAELNKVRKQIIKQLKTAKPKKQAGKPVGKFTANVQDQLDTLRTAFKLSADQAQAKIADNLSRYQGDQLPPDSVVIENRVLDMVARLQVKTEAGAGIPISSKFSLAELQGLLADIKDLKENGQEVAMLRTLDRREQEQADRDALVNVATGGEGIPAGVETTGIEPKKTSLAKLRDIGQRLLGAHYGWDTILDVLSKKDKTSKPFESDISKLFSVHDEENAEKQGHATQLLKITEMAQDVFGTKALKKKFNNDNDVISIGEFTNNNGARIALNMTRAEARKFMMEYKDPTLRNTIVDGMGFTDEMLAAVDGVLTPEDKAFMDRQIEFYRKYYDRVNEKYREHYGVSLPFNEFYSPIKREGFKAPEGVFSDFLVDIQTRRSIAPVGLKTRTKNIFRLARQSDVNAMQRHIVEMEHFIAFADKIRQLNAVFKDSTVRTAIALNHNSTMLNIIDDFIGRFTRGGTELSNRLNAVDKLRANMTRSVLAIKPLILTKQLISTVAGAENMPVTNYAAGIADFWTHPIETFKFFKENSIWFQERSNFQERDIKTALSSQEFSNFQRHKGWLDMLMLNVRVGDQAAIIAAGWSRYRWQTKVNGMTQEQAIRDFETNAERVQQSGDLSQLSNIQTRGSITKLLTMFLSSPIQYVNREASALRNLAAGRQSVAQTTKAVAIYHVIIPLLFQFMADGFQWDKEEDLRAVLLGPFNGLVLVGQLMAGLAAAIAGSDIRSANIPLITPLSSTLYPLKTILEDILDGDLPIEDVHRAIREFSGLGGALTGLPLKSGFDTISGVSDGLTGGQFDDAFLSVMGLTPNVIEKRSAGR